MVSDPRVSVILPTHDRAQLLPRSVESVLAQSFRDFELIVVDDASRDETRAVLARYGAEDPRVHVIRSDANLGGGGARNLGLRAARGRLIAFQDSDDYWLPNKLAAQVAALEANPSCGLCYCGSIYYGDRESYYLPKTQFGRLDGDMSLEVLKGNPTSTQTIVLRRDVIDRAGGFDERLKRLQDWDLVIRLAEVTPFAFLSEPLVLIYETPGNISSFPINDARFRSLILRKYAERFARAPAELSRHHYIAGRTWQKHGAYREAARHLTRAFSLRPGIRSLVSLASATLMGMVRPDTERASAISSPGEHRAEERRRPPPDLVRRKG